MTERAEDSLRLLGIPMPKIAVKPDDWWEARERLERRQALHEIWRHSPGPKLLRRPTRPEYAAAANEWKPGSSLILNGPTRSGKSSALARLLARLCKSASDLGGEHMDLARSTLWVRADALTKAGRGDNGYADFELLRRAEHCRLLILDDIAKPSTTILYVLQQRYDRDLDILGTTGALNESQLMDRMGGEAPLCWLLESGKGVGRLVFAKNSK